LESICEAGEKGLDFLGEGVRSKVGMWGLPRGGRLEEEPGKCALHGSALHETKMPRQKNGLEVPHIVKKEDN